MPEPKILSCAVVSIPQPGGSKQAFIMGKRVMVRGQKAVLNPRVVLKDANDAKVKPWRAACASAAAHMMSALEVADARPWDGAVQLEAVFTVPRPGGHYGVNGLKPSAPRYPKVKPDLTKLLRAAEDAFKGIVWTDDQRVVAQLTRKLYPLDPRWDPVRGQLGNPGATFFFHLLES